MARMIYQQMALAFGFSREPLLNYIENREADASFDFSKQFFNPTIKIGEMQRN